jgi:hypothetical protein
MKENKGIMVMSMTDSKPKLVGKMFHRSFLALGEHILESWNAIEVSQNNYVINRSNGTQLEVRVGDEMPNIGLVSVDSNKNLNVGKYTIMSGENIQNGWSAKVTRGTDNFRLRSPEGKFIDVKIGDGIPDFEGAVELDERYDKIKIGNRTIPLYRKQYEQNLIIFDIKERNGHRAFFNLLEPGNENNRKDGVQGVFYPSPGGNKPAKFCEQGPEGKLYATAIFWVSNNKSFLNGKLRDINLAIEEKSIVEEINQISLKMADVEKEAADIGFPVHDHPEYDDYTVMQSGLNGLQDRLSYLNKDAWVSKTFSVSAGLEMLGVTPAKKNPEYTS